ncbi:MAG: tetratricopeptide repeat protein [Deltaproteobacteria bacterium]|nr:tetratricopeptide repeat protein [Deltaproteobacteria bacterium]
MNEPKAPESEEKESSVPLPGQVELQGVTEAIGRNDIPEADRRLTALEPFDKLPPAPRALAMTLRGLILHQQGKLDEAEAAWKSVTGMEKEVPGQAAAAHFNVAVLAATRDQLDVAITHWKEATRFAEVAPPLAVAAHMNLGSAHAKANRRTEAVDEWTKATKFVDVAPDQVARAHMNLADILRDMNEMQRSVEHYLETTKFEQQAPDVAAKAHARLGLYALNADRKEIAQAHWTAAVRLVPTTPVHFELGLLALTAGNRDQAKRHWVVAASQSQVDPVAAAKSHLNLGQLARDQKALDQTRAHWKESSELAWHLLRKGINERAVELLEVLRKSSVGEAQVLAELGDKEGAKSRSEDALEDLEDVLGFFQKGLGADSAEVDDLFKLLEGKGPVERALFARPLANLVAELARARVETGPFLGGNETELRAALEKQVELANRILRLDPTLPKPNAEPAQA